MSDALSYLVKARPEAMGHYFAFLKDAGSHLDPKTRALISVITKVHAQTERGLRQYLKRALADGCTAAEVLDALLMAFPALGLAKIVWAVDVILAMDLPAFRLEALPASGPASAATQAQGVAAAVVTWHDVIATDAVAPGLTLRVECEGRGLFVHRLAAASAASAMPSSSGAPDSSDEWRVWDSRCPHETTDIPHLALQGCTLTCPKHEWVFDVRSGACIQKGTRPLHHLPSRESQGRLLAQW